jgi:hypothetical protein
VRVSKSAVAGEWLIFLPLFALGGFVSFFGAYYHDNPSFYGSFKDTGLSASYDAFWNDTFGLARAWSLFLWFLPYLAVTLIRSIWWSIRALSGDRSLRRVSIFSLLGLILTALLCFGVVVFENAQRTAAARASEIRHFDPATLSLVQGPPKTLETKSLYNKLVAYLEKKQKRPIQVEIPGKGIVEFPTDASRDEIAAAIKRYFFSAKTSQPWPGHRELSDAEVGLLGPSPKPRIETALSASQFLDADDSAKTPTPPAASKYADLLEAAPPGKPPSKQTQFDEIPISPRPRHKDPIIDFEPEMATADLKKITLFDIGVEETPHIVRARDSEHGIFEFHGRLRNELSRAVQGVVLKASVYNAAGELIEVKKFRLYERPFEPNAPTSFSGIVDIQHLPEGYKYRLEVIEAHYAAAK